MKANRRKRDEEQKVTRRRLFQLLGAAVAAVGAKGLITTMTPETTRSTWNGKTRWIGHC